MDTFLEIGLRNAILAIPLAIAALLAGRLSRRPALTHVLWVLVLLQLMLPPLWRVTLSRPAWMQASIERVAESTEPILVLAVNEPAQIIDDNLPADVADTTLDTVVTGPAELPAEPEKAASTEPPTIENARAAPAMWSSLLVKFRDGWWRSALGIAWLSGSIFVLAVALMRVLRFQLALTRALPASAELQAQVARLAAQMGLSTAPTAVLVSGRVSPLLWGVVGQPRLVLPSQLWQRLDAARREALLVHELAHYRRGDQWVRVIEAAAGVLFWWHPVMWLARRQLREAEEQCCDAWVVWTLPDSRRDYASAIVDTLDFLADSRPVLPALASGVGEVLHLRRRVTMIMRGNTPRRLPRIALLGMLGVGLALATLGASFADEPKKDEPRRDPPKERRDAERRPEGERRDDAERAKIREELERARAQFEEARRRLEELEKRFGGGDRRPDLPMRRDGDRPAGAGDRPRDPRPGERVTPPRFRDGERPVPPMPPSPPFAPGLPGAPGGREGGPGGNLEQRITAMERQLQDMMRALEEMRRGMQGGRPGAGPGDPGGRPGAAPGAPGGAGGRPGRPGEPRQAR